MTLHIESTPPVVAGQIGEVTEAPARRRHFSDSVSVLGLGLEPRCFDKTELERMADAESGPLSIICYSGRPIRDVAYVRGVRLTELLDASGLRALPRAQCKKLIFAVRARDGYVALFTWHELYNSPIGQGAMLLVEQDGEVLPPSAGGLQLISLGDIHLGPRQALAVETIEVRSW